MNTLELLKQEHEDIERELLEMEAIINAGSINYSNLVHVFKNLVNFWNDHEDKEERIFPIMKKEKIIIPVKKMQFDHRDLRVHKKAIMDALETGKGIREALDNNCGIIVNKLRKHIEDEDQVLYTIALSEFSDKEIEEMASVAGIKNN